MRDHSELTLRKQKDFNKVYNRGRSKGSRFVVVLYRKNNLDFTRTAFVSSKKVGNSVERNRSRRLMKEAYRSLEGRVKKGYDIVFVGRNDAPERTSCDIERFISERLIGEINKSAEKGAFDKPKKKGR